MSRWMRFPRAVVLGVGLLSLIVPACSRSTASGATSGGGATTVASHDSVPDSTVWPDASRAEAPGGLTVTGPYAVANLAVYLLHSDERDDREFLTLDQGMTSGLVTVSEKASASVQELLIENRSDHPLFLQEGDRLVGGKQDRTIYASLVIPANSGERRIPTFCVEPGRWVAAGGNVEFDTAQSGALAPRGVRLAAKIGKNQGEVWREVGEYRDDAMLALADSEISDARLSQLRQLGYLGYSGGGGGAGVVMATSSLNDAMEMPELRERCEVYEQSLGSVATAYADTVGVAFALDGKITEVDLYPGHPLLIKVYPRLLRSYAMEAGLKPSDEIEAPAAEAVVAFLGEEYATHLRDEAIDKANHLRISDLGNRYRAVSTWENRPLQLQVLAR